RLRGRRGGKRVCRRGGRDPKIPRAGVRFSLLARSARDLSSTGKPEEKTRITEGGKQTMNERADLIFTGVPEGLDALALVRLAEEAASGEKPGVLVHVARDDRRLEALKGQLKFFAPTLRVVTFPAWDTVPYDRVGP